MSPMPEASSPSERLRVPARTAWATMLAYSRAVRVGREVFVSGTLPVDAQGRVVGDDDARLQAEQVLHLIEQALAEAGARIADVVRLRIYLRDYADLPAIAAAQAGVFAHVQPACTVLRTELAGSAFLVQMDADARVSEADDLGTCAAM